MWIFGYGSLMWDHWEQAHGCWRTVTADLAGFRREFNKASVKNWGTKQCPAPTLNLVKELSSVCTGVAFEFSDDSRETVTSYLNKREGKNFELEKVQIQLHDGGVVSSRAPMYRGVNLIGGKSLSERAEMARQARGTRGRCIDYVDGIYDDLAKLGIDDASVAEFWGLVKGDVQS